ncbi:hypothetical protein [Nocardia sp. NPDC059239]|uniref:hypothetical protein n=1 Tax=Nocardia sp. NPDC059239 TaxID=3346785 RepID=UPI0036BB076D
MPRDRSGPMPERFALRGVFDPLPTSPVERIRATLDLIELHTRNFPGEDQRFAHLAALGELRRVLGPAVTALENRLAADAFAHGATMADLANAAGMSGQGARDRWAALAGSHYVVVISRRDRQYKTREGDPLERVGEIGGADQYDADRGVWRVGVNVRAAARHAVIAVDRSVRRVYEIDPDGWEPNPDNPREWRFRAVGDRELSPELVDELHAAGELPYRIGSHCPTKAGGAYRPERFWPQRERAERFIEHASSAPLGVLPPELTDDPTTGEQP